MTALSSHSTDLCRYALLIVCLILRIYPMICLDFRSSDAWFSVKIAKCVKVAFFAPNFQLVIRKVGPWSASDDLERGEN
jgi:hypothetical protein